MIIKNDRKNKFKSMFDPKTGFYLRTGVLDENGKDTGIDPFESSFAELLDIGIMQTCTCHKLCNVDCYQKACDRTGKNMSVENFKKIIDQAKGKVFQIALGGAGNVDDHENFEEILKICREANIVPNFTTSGILMNRERAEICKKYCGAVAVSQHSDLKKAIVVKEKKDLVEGELDKFNPYVETFTKLNETLFSNNWYFSDTLKQENDWVAKEIYYEDEESYTYKAIKMLLDAGVSTSIHYVLSKKSIDEAIIRLKNNAFPKGIMAVVFLLYKPVGLGKEENMLDVNDPRVKEFFELIDTGKFSFKIGFDSCSSPGIVNFSKNTNLDSVDYCEGARFSAYIDANMNMMPCSFANQDPSWHMNLNEYTMQEVWDSPLFDKFRYSLKNSCTSCPKRVSCGGGCPLVNQITLCNNKEREFKSEI